ncbi:transposable element Tcb2 transposase [Trichonephila clavipes]|nr:transposable element Tcb2 transposase [Trichonephila clavipes]
MLPQREMTNNQSVRQHLDAFTPGRIIGKLEEGRSVTSVAAEFGIAHSIVSRLWRQFQTTGTAIRGFSSGRLRGTTPADDRYIVLQARRNRRQTAGEIAKHTTQATGRRYRVFTVARRLHGGGLFARRPVRCVPLTPAHRRRRSLWCREHRNWRDNEWGQVLFTDESRFSVSSAILIAYSSGESGEAAIIPRTSLKGIGAMGLQFLFMEDNAPCHRTVAAEQLLESEDIECMDWPARSPDLNPIEHVWDFLGRRLAARTLPPVTIWELRLALQDEWAAMPQQLIDTLILSLGRRCVTCLAIDGENFNPYIQFIDTKSELFEGTSNLLHIAGLPANIEYPEYKNFKGCISNVMIEFGDLRLTPLETAFGYKKGSLDKVRVEGTVNERKCAAFAQVSRLTATLPSNIPPEIQGPEWFPEPPSTSEYRSIFSDMAVTPLESISRASNRVAAVMGVLLIIVLLALMFYIYRIQRRHKRQRLGEEYEIFKKGKRRTVSGDRSGKAVSFSSDDDKIDDYALSSQPLVRFHDSPPAYTPSVSFKKPTFMPSEPNGGNVRFNSEAPEDSIEMAPLRSTSSQELEWDPAGAQLVSAAMDDMNPDESEKQAGESDDEDGPLPELKNQFAPLASASEVTINRLSQTFA